MNPKHAVMVVVTEFSSRFVPEEIAKAAGAKGTGRQHWCVKRRIVQWADWMDRCDGLR